MGLLIRTAICAFVLVRAGLPASTSAAPSDESAVRAAFPGCDAFEERLVLPSADQRSELEKTLGKDRVPRVFSCWVARKGETLEGFAVVDDVLGKSEPITYLVALDSSVRVRFVEILAYRESHGGEVREANWRRQFEGLDARSPISIGKDIRNIAGATISCRSVTDGVRHQVALLSVLSSEVARSSKSAGATWSEAGPIAKSSSCTVTLGPDIVQRTRLMMGTTLRIAVAGLPEARANAACDEAFSEVERLERELSTWIADSAVSHLNTDAGGAMHALPIGVSTCLERALRISEASAGAFDPVCGAATELWREASHRNAMPLENEIANARAVCGRELLELDAASSAARLRVKGARIDLGGIGKGFALDTVQPVLERAGANMALLDFGGQILALDAPPGTPGWQVDLRNPIHPEGTTATIWLSRASIASSADYERGLQVGSAPVSHIVDPRSGLPAADTLATIVISANATDADAWSTALFVLGPGPGLLAATRNKICARIVSHSRVVSDTPDFGTHIAADRAR